MPYKIYFMTILINARRLLAGRDLINKKAPRGGAKRDKKYNGEGVAQSALISGDARLLAGTRNEV
jgi:hypothetical protein